MDFLKWKERYSTDCKLKYPSKATQDNYISNISLFLYNFKDFKEPKSILTDDIKKWLLETKSPNTRNQRLCAIKSFYRLTVNMSIKLDKIPFSRKSQSLPVPLSINEVKMLINSCENKKHLAIIYLLFGCGLRVGEVINLKPNNIHRSEKVIHIVNGKGAKDRFVPLDNCVLYVLEEYWKEYRPTLWMFNGQYSTIDTPTQYTDRSINQFLKDIAKKAGIQKRLHSHLGRHSYASQLVESGVDISLIQNILGHKRQSTTLIYTKITSSVINKVICPLSQIDIKH
jgi:integrase/recombinase XerD